MRSVKKYAIRFPGLDTCRTQNSLSIFSENSIAETHKSFLQFLNAAESLSGFIIQKNRTQELGKRLSAQKAALDVENENLKEQLRLQYIEESNRIKIRLETEKQELEMDFQKLMWESSEKSKEFNFSFEQYMCTNRLLYAIVSREKDLIEYIQPYIEQLSTDYSNRKEYIMYCEIERKCIALIDEYIKQMI